jgi:hypothetical protein
MSLLHHGARREALAVAPHFRDDFFGCLTARADTQFELTDALLCADGPVTTPVDLTLTAEHRRGHGAMWTSPTGSGRTVRTACSVTSTAAADAP